MIKRPLGLGCLAVAAFLYFYALLADAPYMDYSEFQGEKVTVTGKVYKKETVVQAGGAASVVYLDLKEGMTGREENTGPAGGKVICYLKKDQPEAEMGSCVRLEGKVSCFERASNPGQFDAYSYYQISGISYRINQAEIKAKTKKYNKFTQALYELRVFLADKLKGALNEEEASIMQTMLLGEKGSLDRDLKELYQRNGIAHILAISGLHVSVLGMGLYHFFRKCRVPMKMAAVFSAGVMILYGIMTGFSVSALRAIVMFVIHMAAVVLERTYDMLTAVAVTAVLILLDQPRYFFHSGFLFSFGCVLGIGLLLPKMMEAAEKRNFVIKAAAGGVGITVITLPVYLWFYYQYPVCSIFLNLLILPFMSFLLMAGIGLIICEILCPGFSFPFELMIKGILQMIEVLFHFCDRFPGMLLTVGRPEKWQVAGYLFLLIFIIAAGKRLKPVMRWCIILPAALLLICPVQNLFSRSMEITFLDVGQGDSIFIANDNGNCYLIDGGSSTVSNVGKYRIIPFLKCRGASRLEAVFITHPDEDHCSGIKELIETGGQQGIKIANLVLPDIGKETKNEAYIELEQMAESARIPVSYISREQKVIDDKLTLTCLGPVKGETFSGANEYSIVMKASYGCFSAMLTGDVEGGGEEKLIRYLEDEGLEKTNVTVLKAAHHGSAYSTPAAFLDQVKPVYTIISCGKNNTYGHPHQELLERLKECNTNISVTYETGALTFTTDGQKVQFIKFFDE